MCIVTKQESPGNYSNIVKNVPVNDIIIERSAPLGLARMRAIQKVKTEWFAFIDDDVFLTQSWFKTIASFIKEDIGAIQGITFVKGPGENWDRDINAFLFSSRRTIRELGLGERGWTHNTLLKAAAVKDWKPSRTDLSAWEDYEITQHILKKGYRWLAVPVDAYHIWSWKKRWNNAIWSMKSYKKIHAKKLWLKVTILHILDAFRLLFDWLFLSLPIRTRVYRFPLFGLPFLVGFMPLGARVWYLYQTIGCICGLLKSGYC